MIRIFIFFSLFFFNHQLFSQSASNDLKDLLIGDWYYFENKEDNCGFETSYHEIVFNDSLYLVVNHCNQYTFHLYHSIDNDMITGYAENDSIVMQGLITILDSFRFKIDFDDSHLVFHRIIDDHYKLSEHIKDNIKVNNLRLHLPQQLMIDIYDIGSDYYYNCAERRELWYRLERKEIDKQRVLDWADKMIENSDHGFQEREYLVFRNMVDNIFD